jgi:hypothetical protein
VGDRFSHQSKAQLRACALAAERGVDIIPVWNKSNREHTIIGSQPASVREAVDCAVAALVWKRPYFVDADHINLATVDRFIEACDFYTIDVADWIGQPADPSDVESFVKRHSELGGAAEPAARKYLAAVREAGRIYRHVEERKGKASFVTEVSMDETDAAQTPAELLVILAAIADEKVPIQTIAPKFTGRFNKGVDYVGDVGTFEQEFAEDIETIDRAVRTYELPADLKLSVHSGSDKFSIYAAIHRTLTKTGAGVHVKTAGTTWLEELIGLAESGGEGLALAKEVYAEAYAHRDDLCKPYVAVIDIDAARLPLPEAVNRWSSDQFTAALRHDPRCVDFNSSFRQLLHVGFKIAAKMGRRYLDLLESCEETIARNVTTNLYDRHMRPLFLGEA